MVNCSVDGAKRALSGTRRTFAGEPSIMDFRRRFCNPLAHDSDERFSRSSQNSSGYPLFPSLRMVSRNKSALSRVILNRKPFNTSTSRRFMGSQAERIEIDIHCARCRRRIRWAWLITYRSFRFVRLVYVCSECGGVIKVENALRGEGPVMRLDHSSPPTACT